MSLYFIVNSVLDGETSEMQRALTLAQGLARSAEFGVTTNHSVILEQAAQPVLAVPSIFAVRYFSTGNDTPHEVADPEHESGYVSAIARFARGLFSDLPLRCGVSAETASAFKSQFVANVSHEIRTTLNAIIGTLSVMNKAGLDIAQVDQFDIISSSSNTLLYLIEDILDISRIESGNMVIESISTNLESLLAEIAGNAAIQAVDRGIKLFVSPIPALALRDIYTDPVRLKQMLSNLLTNAIKFTHAGHVSLTTGILESRHGLREVTFIVEDTGIGIPNDKQDSLFSAFIQVDMSSTRRYGGTGLGLFISNGLVELLGGTIQLDSDGMTGTRIQVVLPLKVSANAEQQTPTLNNTVDRIQYFDCYEPLYDMNLQFVKGAFGSVIETEEFHLNGQISVTNVPNRMPSTSWAGPIISATQKPADSGQSCTAQIAWVSLMTPSIMSRLQQAGYTGYVVKTPSLIQLKRHLQMALGGQ